MKLKELFIEWLTESRYIRALESFRAEQKADFNAMLADKNGQIRALRAELEAVKSECERLRNPSRLYQGVTPRPPSPPAVDLPQDWQGELNRMLQEEEDGIRSPGRVQEHQPSADDGA